MSQKVLFITPPFTQLNTPYPATAYLKGFLNTKSIQSNQCDLGIETILAIFSSSGLTSLFANAEPKVVELTDNCQRIFNLRDVYIQTIDNVIGFLQEKNSALAHLICEGSYLPKASRFSQTDDLDWAFGSMGLHDKAKHLATLYLEDLSDFISEAVDPHFGFSRYAERLGRSATSFDEIENALQTPSVFIDSTLIQLLQHKIEKYSPTIVALSVPFPGNLYCALKCGKWLKQHHQSIKVVLGGGFANTELRLLTEKRIFDYVDFITLDDGEIPLLNIIEHIDGQRNKAELKRTFIRETDKVTYINGLTQNDAAQCEVGTPDYADLLLNNYLSVIEVANPMHRLWSDGRWNKLTLAHGCYWGQCTFCDTSLDYICRYEPNSATDICDRIETIIAETGNIGFHFVDEAAPPNLLRELALEIIRRKITLVWWTNIRFEKSFSFDLCQLLKTAGCIAVSGGLEVASDRLLKLIKKGVSVESVAKVTNCFTKSGIMVHAYLMYGFPTQTAQETIDSLEMVRQMFEANIIQSGFWHQFALTTHSFIGTYASQFNIEIENKIPGSFANNDLQFTDVTGIKHEIYSDGLRKSIFNYMHGIGFEIPLNNWFETKVPRTTVPPNFIKQKIENNPIELTKPTSKIVWLGTLPSIHYSTRKKREITYEMAELIFTTKNENLTVKLSHDEGKWLYEKLPQLFIRNTNGVTFNELQKSFEEQTKADFILFWNNPAILKLRANGLLAL